MAQWFLDRLYKHKDQPTARFAFMGSINWIRALALALEEVLSTYRAEPSKFGQTHLNLNFGHN